MVVDDPPLARATRERLWAEHTAGGSLRRLAGEAGPLRRLLGPAQGLVLGA